MVDFIVIHSIINTDALIIEKESITVFTNNFHNKKNILVFLALSKIKDIKNLKLLKKVNLIIILNKNSQYQTNNMINGKFCSS